MKSPITSRRLRATLYNPQHVLRLLLPPPKQTGYNLRSRGHGLALPQLPGLEFDYLRKISFAA